MITVDLDERLDRGVQLLDQFYTEHWVWIIDPDQIVMEEACGCVVGQLERKVFGPDENGYSFYTGLDRMTIHGDSDRFAFDLPSRAADYLDPITWVGLADAWREKIAELREERA